MGKTVKEHYAILLRYLKLSIQMLVPLKLIKTRVKNFTNQNILNLCY